jgi:cytochrome bd-type quinol oxidase subunit 2
MEKISDKEGFIGMENESFGAVPSEPSKPQSAPSTASAVSMICGIIACLLNVLILTSPIGVIFGLIAFVSAAIAWFSARQGRAGMVLSLFSFFILTIWLVSIVFPLVVDPTLQMDNWPKK